ncbi:DnaD domain-containing protein [Ornithinibacillus halophilus]|uniref:DnaD and phage-associated domain-containing protein n=1 Tax=Ornithinibacillus halophilus TaxID=930117 RepID=A0A1M5GJR0_9BACI|nr:DnaD domain protein [Ornithinibacillus halophilus]SHG03933.1 DnaD and phage-associated domain-containing protein [Ornithinibacillus halophilus]
MNYIKEINAFYNCLERNPLSASAVTLWHALMHINNKAAWTKEFTVSGLVLRLKSGLTESSFKRARTELKKKGYINYQSRGSNQAPIYQIVKLSFDVGGGNGVSGDSCDCGASGESERPGTDGKDDLANGEVNHEVNHNMDHRKNYSMNQQANPLTKQNKTKRNEINLATSDAIVFYHENFGVIPPFVTEDLLKWVDDLGEDMVLEAMKRALERNKATWGYVKGILNAWAKKGIRTVEQVEAEERKFLRERKGGDGYGQWKKARQSDEIVPEWFLERKRKEKNTVIAMDGGEQEDVGEMLRKYKEGGAI